MLDSFSLLLCVGGYLAALFGLALWAERRVRTHGRLPFAEVVYALSLAVYCTSWTYYGSVGKAATSGLMFLPIYLGPTAAFALWPTLLKRLVRLKERYRVTSVADLISARYGKSQTLAALATLLALLGVSPYIALQLKAVNQTFALVTGGATHSGHLDLAVVAGLGLLTVMFGARRLDPTERHQGIVAVLAVECLVKLTAFLAAGAFVTWGLHDGIGDVLGHLPELAARSGLDDNPSYVSWATSFVLSMSAVVLLPRQFHVLVVENSNPRHLRTAAWLFPLYMVLINLFVVPLAAGGLLAGLPLERADTFVLELPLRFGSPGLALFVFLGGFSAATGMIVVSTMSLATMATNHLLLPVAEWVPPLRFLRRCLLPCRWGAVVAILLVGYGFQRLLGGSYMLVNMGMISFAAVLQFAPAVLAALFWKDASRNGALLGLGAGFALWFYTLLLPALVKSGWLAASLLRDGPWGVAVLRPEHLFGVVGLDSLSHAVFWTLFANVGLLVAGSLLSRQGAEERATAEAFARGDEATVAAPGTDGDSISLAGKLAVLEGLFGQYYPPERAGELVTQARRETGVADRDQVGPRQLAELVGCAERLLAGAVGPPAAHRAVREAGLYTREEAAGVARVYSKMLADLMVSPAELRERVDLYQERSALLHQQAATLEQQVREKEAEVAARTRAERESQVLYLRQRALRKLLEVPLSDLTLDAQLARYLEVIFALDEFRGLPKGAVLLADEGGAPSLHLAASLGLDSELGSLCAVVPFGHCLCGAAAAERHTLFVDRVGAEHSVRFDGMADHGHYCLPLLSEDEVLGGAHPLRARRPHQQRGGGGLPGGRGRHPHQPDPQEARRRGPPPNRKTPAGDPRFYAGGGLPEGYRGPLSHDQPAPRGTVPHGPGGAGGQERLRPVSFSGCGFGPEPRRRGDGRR